MAHNTSPDTETADQPLLMTPAEVAALLRRPEQTLANWRCSHRGPPFIRLGRSVRYAREDVVAWLEDNRVATTK